MRLLPCGPRAVLVELDDAAERRRWTAALPGLDLPVTDIVPAARTILCVATGPDELAEVRAKLATVHPQETIEGAEPETVEVRVRYDGPDLDEVAGHLGISAAEVVARHTGQEWTVDFTGFLPGFGYLVGDDAWEVPRRPSPRTSVPVGAVGLAGPFTGVYPRSSPGGWQLIGTALTPVWDPAAADPALLSPGRRVRFVVGDGEPAEPAPRPADPVSGGLTVLDPGPLLLVEDLGRPGQLALGVARSGAFDRAALRLGNRLLDNPESAAGLELMLTAMLRADQDVWICVTGAPGTVRVAGRAVSTRAPVHVRAGQEIALGPGESGIRRYLCVRGGIDGEPELGSLSAQPSAGIGRPPLRAGDRLAVGATSGTTWPDPDTVVEPGTPTGIRATWGPRADWFTAEARELFVGTRWQVGAEADRTGVRLDGVSLAREITGELPSEGLVPGAVQVPTDGRPLVFGPDHPATGGYPVLAVVDDVDAIGRLRPGDPIRFSIG